MHISVIGTGYVGLVTGACFSEFGVFVTCVDKDEKKIDSLNHGIIPFYEPGLEEITKRNVKKGTLTFTTNIGEPLEASLAIFIAVGTPPQGDGSADLTSIEEVAEEIAKHIKNYKVIVTKSTVPVGTGERIRKIISHGLKEQIDFDIVSNPEFLREGSAIEDFMRPNRVVIGARSQQAIAIMKDLYRPLYLIETPFVITDIETAELVKYASNAFLATKISFINEIALLCEKVGADVNVVAKGMGFDGRIGPKFLHAGPGFGGSCFPKDTKALLKIGADHGIDLGIIGATIKANERQLLWVTGKLKRVLGVIADKTIAVLGLSFKPNTDDIREAPAISLIHNLLRDGAKITCYDPVAMDNTMKILPEIGYHNNAYEACSGADAVVIVTEWNEFRNLDLERLMHLLKQPNFFDLRNVYDPPKMAALGFRYHSVGRTAQTDDHHAAQI
jgi:UDPglucose 6-dehydrogenase